jgi:hypothetical protein
VLLLPSRVDQVAAPRSLLGPGPQSAADWLWHTAHVDLFDLEEGLFFPLLEQAPELLFVVVGSSLHQTLHACTPDGECPVRSIL